jgi:hypothetical protein
MNLFALQVKYAQSRSVHMLEVCLVKRFASSLVGENPNFRIEVSTT